MLKMGFDWPPTILEVRGHAALIGVRRTGKVQEVTEAVIKATSAVFFLKFGGP
jgi:hypothetical protein